MATICERLLNTDRFSDVEFIVQNGIHSDKIRGHKAIFAESNEVFEKMLYGVLAEGNSIEIKDVEPQAFKALKRFLYTEKVEFKSMELAMSVYKVAHRYELGLLMKTAAKFIADNVSFQAAVTVLKFSILYGDSEIEAKCIDIITNGTVSVLESDDFLNADISVLEIIVNKDELNATEFELFKAVEKWAKHNLETEDLHL